MSTRYFHKQGPETPILMPKGDRLFFKTLDGVDGYYATLDQNEIDAFMSLIQRHAGGLKVITQEEYEEQYEKKSATSQPFVQRFKRETFGASSIASDTQVRRSVAAAVQEVSVDTGSPAPAVEASEKPARAPIVPRVGKRVIADS